MKLLMLLPISLLPLALFGIGLAVMTGFMTVRVALRNIGILLLIAVFSPYLDQIFSSLPIWVSLLIMAALMISMFNWIISALFGRGTSSHLWALLLHDVILLPFRFVGMLLRRR